MARYIVPKEMPKACNECPFCYCTEYHPFWSGDKEKRNTKTIRCQAITPFRKTVLAIDDESFKADWCPLVDAADVVPKSEVEALDREIERLKKSMLPSYCQAVSEEEAIKIGKAYGRAEVARGIFEEIDGLLKKRIRKYGRLASSTIESAPAQIYNSAYATAIDVQSELAELKKKYTEGET